VRAAALFFKFLWDLFVLLTPLFGVWLASSLSAYLDSPRWAALAAGALLFPVLPVAWEILAELRKRRKNPEGKRFLKRPDRLVLRTLFINLAFSGALLGIYPAASFAALSTRGDWFLPDKPWTEHPRAALFWTAGKLEFLYTWARPNEYKPKDKDAPPPPPPSQRGDLEEKPKDKPTPDQPAPTETCAPGVKGCVPAWPLEEKLHPLVAEMPADQKKSIQDVGNYLRLEPNPYFRVKAIHDFVADHITYDTAYLNAIMAGNAVRKPQDAQTVFKNGVGVCEGYARLAVALGEITGDKIVYVTGHTRTPSGELEGVGHAWNAVEINGKWFLMDPTWDSGADLNGKWTKKYESDYLLTPAKVFGLSHFPENDSWQLLEQPITRGEFLAPADLAAGLLLRGAEAHPPDALAGGRDGQHGARHRQPQGQRAHRADRPRGRRPRAEVQGVRPGSVRLHVRPADEGQVLGADLRRATRRDQALAGGHRQRHLALSERGLDPPRNFTIRFL
jgi:hypothetical protein